MLRVASTGQDESLADFMPHGAIYWRPDADKRSYEDVAPISAPARTALDAYLREHPRVGEAPLFPSERDPARSIDNIVAGRLLLKAEALAKLPKLERGRWHPYRRLFAVERKHEPDVDVARVAGPAHDEAALSARRPRHDAQSAGKRHGRAHIGPTIKLSNDGSTA